VGPVVSINVPIGKTDGNSGSPLPSKKIPSSSPWHLFHLDGAFPTYLPFGSSALALSSGVKLAWKTKCVCGPSSRLFANLLEICFSASFLAIALPFHEISCFAEVAGYVKLDIASVTILSFSGKYSMVRSN